MPTTVSDMGDCIKVNLSLGKNWTKSETVSKDKTYYYRKYPQESVDLLRAKLDGLEGYKMKFERLDAELLTDGIQCWINNVGRLQTDIKALLKSTQQGEDFASKVESKLKAAEEYKTQINGLDEEVKRRQGSNGSRLSSNSHTTRNDTHDHPRSELIGIQCNVDKIIKLIKTTKYAVIGIWGACGIGKTAVLTELKNRITSNEFQMGLNNEEKQCLSFTKVIKVIIGPSKTWNNIEHIQKKIAEDLEFSTEDKDIFDKMDLHKRANKLSEALAKEKILIMLDDVWPDFKLLPLIGIKRLPDNSESKIVYTTRLKTVCAELEPCAILAMELLSPSDSLTLFQERRRIEDDDIRDMLLRKCAGLPLALITVALGTAARGPKEVYRCLNHSPTEIKGIKENVLDVLKPSFDSLNDAATKECFLFCVLFQDSKDIDCSILKDYWIGEALLGHGTLQSSRDRADDIVEQLWGCCLLEKTCDATHVKMHNTVRMMAIWLAQGGADGQLQFQFYAGEDLSEDDVEKIKEVKRASFVDTETDVVVVLKKIPDCEKLVTLLLRLQESRKISHLSKKGQSITAGFTELFGKKKFPICRVLDMAHQPVTKLPDKLCKLETLRYLNLSYTCIETLPDGLGNLKQLILLDLTGTKKLRQIRRKAISSLSKLISLKIRDSSYIGLNSANQLTLEDLAKLYWLSELQLPLPNFESLSQLSECETLAKRTTYLQLGRDSLGRNESNIFKKISNLKILSLKSGESELQDKEITFDFNHFQKLETLILRDLNITSRFSFISSNFSPRELHISKCSKLTTIKCLCLLEKLEVLKVETCEEIVKLLPSACEHCQDHTKCLGKLKSLKLDALSKLKEISDCILPFKNLEIVSVIHCPELMKLPIYHCDGRKKIKMSCKKEWWDQLEWVPGSTSASSFFEPN